MSATILRLTKESHADSDDCLPCLGVALLVCVGFWGTVVYLIWSAAHG
jgi:hypothetical protein